ncbi:glycosyltransferase family 4 protein [Bacillus sp. C1]
MKTQGGFPYPYIIKALDEYFGLSSQSNRKKSMVGRSFENITFKVPKKKKLSILIATFWDYPHVGGLSNYIKTLSEGLKKLGHRVDVISPNQFSMSEVERIREDIVPKLKKFFGARYGSYNSTIIKSQKKMYTYEKMLLKKLKSKKYDVFHAQDLFTANILGRFSEHYKCPLLYTPHGMYTFNRLKFGMIEKGSLEEVYYKGLEKQAIEFSNQLIILSDSFRKPLLQLGAKQENMKTVLTGIQYPKTSRAKSTHGNKLVLTCVSRLGPRKGHNLLFDALSQIESEYTDKIKVLIVGDGEMREGLEQQVEALGLSMVEFLGIRDDIPDILAQTDIFVLPTLNDSLPISIIEAMHSGLCVISTKSGGIPELVNHSQTGILVEVGDTKKLADAIKFAITNQQTREKLGENAKKFAKDYLTREAMTTQIEAIYKKSM